MQMSPLLPRLRSSKILRRIDRVKAVALATTGAICSLYRDSRLCAMIVLGTNNTCFLIPFSLFFFISCSLCGFNFLSINRSCNVVHIFFIISWFLLNQRLYNLSYITKVSYAIILAFFMSTLLFKALLHFISFQIAPIDVIFFIET